MPRVICLNAKLSVSPSVAFSFFTEEKKLNSWLTAESKVEKRVGGKYELFWDPTRPEENSTLGCRISAYTLNELLAFEWKGPAAFQKFMNLADPLTHVCIFFTPSRVESGSGVTIHLIHSGWRNTDEWSQAYQWQSKAWQVAFQELAKYAAEHSLSQ
jgi:uncharacterized protein YndB with AHSA1/START domain